MIYRPLLLFFLTSSIVFAGDIARDIRQGGVSSQNSNHLELGLGLYYLENQVLGFASGPYEVGLQLLLDGRYQWQRIFVEAITESERGLTFGLSIVDNEKWSLALLASNQHSEISEDIDDEIDGISDRNADFMLGIRSTMAFASTMAELELATDISDTHNGDIFALSFGKFWQYRNLNLHSQIGFRYSSKEVANYYVGIDPGRDAISDRFQSYSVDTGAKEFKIEFGATYPINENWVFRSTAQSFLFSSEVTDSPLATDHSHLLWLNSISRVF